MRCKACNNLLKDTETRYTESRGTFEDMCSSCLEQVAIMRYTEPQVGPVDDYIIYPPNKKGTQENETEN